MQDYSIHWPSLVKDQLSATGYTRIRIEPDNCCNLFMAVNNFDCNKAFVIEVHTRSIPPTIQYPESDGFTIHVETVTPGPSGDTRLILQATDNKFDDVFIALVNDIISHLCYKTEQTSAIVELISRLRRWQKFLQKHAINWLSDTAVQGLYGELYFMQEMLIQDVPAETIVTAWVGPEMANQDFQFPKCAVEVKTNASGNLQQIQVNNLRQLDDTDIDTLLLFYLSLEKQLTQSESLPDLIFKIRHHLKAKAALSLDTFDDKLIDTGYLQVHTKRYENIRYSVKNKYYYRIMDEFPRLTRSMVQAGVDNVRYTISIDACQEFIVDPVLAINYIRG